MWRTDRRQIVDNSFVSEKADFKFVVSKWKLIKVSSFNVPLKICLLIPLYRNRELPDKNILTSFNMLEHIVPACGTLLESISVYNY